MTETDNEMQAVIDVAQEAADPFELETGRAYSVVVPDSSSHLTFDTDDRLQAPRRKRGHPSFFTAGSLSTYVNDHKLDGTAVYADVDRRTIVAVLNGHTATALDGEPGWGDHRATLHLRHTPEWQRWIARDGKIEGQTRFAEHIEDCLADIVEPEGAVMLELAQHFQAAAKVNFRSAKQLSDGQRQLVYEETIEAKAGQRGEITIPQFFVVGVAPFEGSAGYKIRARLRYRLAEGALAIGYVLDRPDKVVRAAFDDVLAEVEQTTELKSFAGTP